MSKKRQKKLLVKSGCFLSLNFLTLRSIILMQKNLLVATELVVSGTQCIIMIL